MNINFYFIFTALCTAISLQASQAVQKETAQHRQATQLELQMIEYAQTGRLTEEALQQYLEKGADINAQNKFGHTALILASVNDHTAVVQQLIAAGADINAKDSYGNTALIWASDRNRTAVVQQLIAAGADINAKDNYGITALMLASRYGRTAVVQQLIAAGADIDIQDIYGDTALMWASHNGHPAVVQQLIAAGADHTIANEKDNNKTARDYAKNQKAYDKAVEAGLQERKEYLDRQPLAKQIVAEQTTHIPGLQDIIMEYAYGPSPIDLPPTQKKSNCVIQ